MNEISSTSVFQDLAIGKKNKADTEQSDELGQKAFLKLMITQLENQDPLSPQENTEFIAQLAQFSSVESLDRLNTNFDSFSENFVANQALQASSLVGRSVTVPSSSTLLEPGGVVTAAAELPNATGDLKLSITNEYGELVDQISLGAQPAGELVLRWDGVSAELNGELLDWQSSHESGVPPGKYHFSFNAQADGKSVQLESYLSANVNSVTVGKGGLLTLNLAGVGAVSLADVKQFNE